MVTETDEITRALEAAQRAWPGETSRVGASFEDEGYAATRAFHAARGLLPLQEFDELDWDGPTLVLVTPLGVRTG